MFHEVVLLRTTWSVFFAVLTVWTLDRALDRPGLRAYFLCGLSIGLAYLLQSTFSLFLLGALALIAWRERRQLPVAGRYAAVLLSGFLLVFAPVVVRNAAVGAPLFSSSSVAATTFVVVNTYPNNPIRIGWFPEAPKHAGILGQTGGRFGPAAQAALATFPSVGAYLGHIWWKMTDVFNGVEVSTNEDYYFYREVVPAIRLAWLDFYWFGWLGVAGLLFCLWPRRREPAPAYLALAMQLAILLGFYVVGRFRTPMAALLLPFAAYAIVELLRPSPWRARLVKLGVAAVCFYLLSYVQYQRNLLAPGIAPYTTLYRQLYFDRVKDNALAGRFADAIAAHTEYMQYEPAFVHTVKPNVILTSSLHLDLAEHFARHYRIHGELLEDSGDRQGGARFLARAEELRSAAERTRAYRESKQQGK
jgi:hypothetical protein